MMQNNHITARKKTGAALSESKARLQVLFDFSPLAIAVHAPDGRFLQCNRAMIDLLGYPEAELATIDPTFPDDRQPGQELYSRLVAGELESYRREKRYLCRDGRVVWAEMMATRICDTDGQLLYLMFIVQDITARKQAEEARQRLETEYRTLAENSPDLIARFDRHLRHTYVNPVAAQAGRLSASEYVGKTILESGVPEPAAERWEQRIRQVLETGQIVDVVDAFPTPDGDRYFHTRFVPELASDGSVQSVLSVARDITERKRTEQALAQTERIYRQAITRAGGVPYQRDYHSDQYSFLGEGIESLTGYTVEEMTGPLFASRLRQTESYGEYRDLPHAERIRLARQGNIKEWRADYLFERKDGSLVWLADHSVSVYDDAGNVMGTVGILIDITARKQAEEKIRAALEAANQSQQALLSVIEDQKRTEEALATERSLLRTLVDHLPVAVYVKDAACRKTLANPADFHNMGAASEAEVLGKTDFDLFPHDLAALFYADDQRVIQSGQPILNREEEVTRPDGTRGWQLTSKVPVRDSAGQVVGLVGIGHDITERVRTEAVRQQAEEVLHLYTEHLEAMVAVRTRELEAAQDRLLRQERLAVLGQVAGGIAHELRNPLGAIKNAAYLLNLLLEPSDPALREALDILNLEVGASDRIINSLLNFARPQRPARQLVEVGQLVTHTLQRAQPLSEIQVDLHADADLPPVVADAGQLEQVFGNLILNAVQAMPQGGRLTVRVEQRASLPDIAPPGFMPECSGDAVAGWIAVSVADTGVGIAPENLSRLFEPLFTTKAKGMGLGLALVKLLTRANGGGVAITSVPGQGAIFETFWPVVPTAQPSS